MIFTLVFVQLLVYLTFGLSLGTKEKFPIKKNKLILLETITKIFLFNVIPRTGFYYWINPNYSFKITSITNFLPNFVLYTALQDILFWIIHKILHIEPLYTLIHKKHHSSYKTKTYGIFGKYMSSMDFIIFELLNCPLKILFFGSDIQSMYQIDIIDYIGTICSHSKLFKLNSHHKIHHYDPNSNFGMTPLSDQIFHTIKYKKDTC
jgi:sterol desaturase/sphingolipid hydroxylase (fatty acid hydroxylase superfamily)